MMAAALLFLLSSCVIEPGIGSGQKVSVKFAASTGNEADDDIVLRSAATAESETQTVSLGHGLFLSATLKPDTAGAGGELRAAEPLANGQKVYLSAYNAGTSTRTGIALYTYTNGNLVADSGSGLEVEVGKTYDFTAYSYYNNTTDTPSATNVDPAKDLVWGRQAGKAITTNDRSVSIVMTRRFSQAKVRISCSTVPDATITALGAVTITSSYANLSIPDGVLTKDTKATAITLSVPFNFTPTNDITSNGTPHMIYPGVQVNIASMTVEVPNDLDSPFDLSDLSMEFNNLTGGKNYVLEMIVAESRWAYSNIYWQAVADVNDARYPGYLTFDVTDQGHQGYQGVFFRWGSLVGVSPAQRGGSDSYSTATPVYIPTYVNGGTSTWSTPATSPSWASIPYLDSSYDATPYGTDNTYASDAARNTPAMYAAKRGDICQYLGKTDAALNGFRLPKRDEFWAEVRQVWNTITPTTDGWLMGDGSFTSANNAGYADGRADFLATQTGIGYNPTQPTNGVGMKLGAGINLVTGAVLPAGGFRNSNLNFVNERGFHWSCSALSEVRGWELFFNAEGVGNLSTPGIDRSSAAPVRCMRKLPGEA
jgi:hypothetical protein